MNRLLLCAMASFMAVGNINGADNVHNIKVHSQNPSGIIDRKIYGQLFEHIYYSANNGVWQEVINERSFEPEHFPGIAPRDGYFDGWYADDEGVLHSPTRYEQPITLAKVDNADFDISMQVDWRAYRLARRLWSGGLLDLRIAFGQTPDGRPVYFRINDPRYEGQRANAGQTEEQRKAFEMDENRKALQKQLSTANFSFAVKVEKEMTWRGGQTRKIEVLDAFASKAAQDGQIDAGGKWHDLNLQVRGDSVTAFWDGAAVLSAKLPEGTRTTGDVTLWENYTEAKIRDIAITENDGRDIVFSGLPKEVMVPATAHGWVSYGEGSFQVEKGDAVNMKHAQRITAPNGRAGLRQGPQNVVPGNPFVGSIYAKGDGKASLSVALKNGDKNVASNELGIPPADAWKRYDFTLDGAGFKGDADFCIEASNGSILVDQVSMATKDGLALGGFRPDIYNAVKDLGVSCMRWPGGGYAAQYDWRWGVGPQEERQRWAHWQWMDYDQNCFGTDEFISFCRAMNSEPVIVVSVGFDRPESEYQAHIDNAVNWLRYCNEPADGEWGAKRAANGHPEPYNVKYWEVDNEMWEMGIERYEQAVRDFSTALRKADPNIKVIVCGGFPEDEEFLNRSAKYFDYMSLHHYEQPGGYLTGPSRLEEQAKRYAAMIAESPNPDIKLYYSEWNLQSIDWRTGLFAAGFLNMAERNPVIEMGAAALFIRRTDMPDWDNAFINFDYKDVFVAPNYQVTKLWQDNFSPYRLDFSGDTGDLSLSTTLSEDGRSVIVKISNATDSDQTLNIEGDWKKATNATFDYYAPGDLMAKNSMEHKDAVALKHADLKTSGKNVAVNVPSYSAGVVKINIAK